jgi:hypothetical protein
MKRERSIALSATDLPKEAVRFSVYLSIIRRVFEDGWVNLRGIRRCKPVCLVTAVVYAAEFDRV